MHFRHLTVCAVPFAAALIVTSPVRSEELFRADLRVDGIERRITSGNAERFLDQLSSNRLRELFPTYTERSAATARVSLRGIAADLSFERNSPRLRLVVPAVGIDQTFLGRTRDESQKQLQEFAKGAAASAGVPTAALHSRDARVVANAVTGSNALTRLLRYAAATTPLDPVAGNPTSLLSRMVQADYDSVVTPTVPGTAYQPAAPGSHWGLGGTALGTSAQGYNGRLFELSSRYAYNFRNGDGVLVDLPVAIADLEGSKVYQASLGLGYRWQVPGVPNWSLTPRARFGFAGSVDAGAIGGIAAGSVTSTLRFNLGAETGLTIGNSVGYGETVPIRIEDYRISYDLANWSFRNGIVLTHCLGELAGRVIDGSVAVTDTRFAGDRLFVNSYREYGIAVSLRNGTTPTAPAPVQVGVSYLDGDRGYHGVIGKLRLSF